jgi:hypothetical protein
VQGTSTTSPRGRDEIDRTDLTMHDLARCAVSAGDRVLDGHVAAFADGTMTVHADPGGEGDGIVRIGDEVEVLVLDEVRGEVRYAGWVARVGATTVRVADLELVSTLQKRKVARVRIAQTCTGVVSSPEGDTRPITFVVLDISAHGMRISTPVEVSQHERIAFPFATRDRVVSLDAEVLRARRTDSGSTHCGCRFVGLDEREVDTLFRYVLQTQGAQRRTRLRS